MCAEVLLHRRCQEPVKRAWLRPIVSPPSPNLCWPNPSHLPETLYITSYISFASDSEFDKLFALIKAVIPRNTSLHQLLLVTTIYRFRNTDWRIPKRKQHGTFPTIGTLKIMAQDILYLGRYPFSLHFLFISINFLNRATQIFALPVHFWLLLLQWPGCQCIHWISTKSWLDFKATFYSLAFQFLFFFFLFFFSFFSKLSINALTVGSWVLIHTSRQQIPNRHWKLGPGNNHCNNKRSFREM